jgi:hypothetical protein
MYTARISLRRREIVTPVFPRKTKCKPICMSWSSFMHIVTYKWITVQYHVRKREIIRDLRFILETKAPNFTGNRLGLHTPSSSNIFTRLQSSFLLLSNIVYSKGKHLSYSASVEHLYSATLFLARLTSKQFPPSEQLEGFMVDRAISI